MTSSRADRYGRTFTPFLLATLVAVAGCSNSDDAAESTTVAPPGSPLLAEVAEQIDLPSQAWTASGTHTAKGYTSDTAETTSGPGMKADCDNINLNKKLAADFRSDVFGDGVKGFFYRCENIAPDTNKYWFTISSADRSQIDRLCDPAATYPIVFDDQHDTYWIDEPFTCESREGPS
ncbi:hypothetical protein ACFTWF_43430 [Rhodococcus sp. NPDC056960]|uniref:hypothetical protein n=1 Tax=Rhodococcus sp. NPDC056960 TaxID=3345982 RepID=UPI003642EC7B